MKNKQIPKTNKTNICLKNKNNCKTELKRVKLVQLVS